jgi:hypothetical protein
MVASFVPSLIFTGWKLSALSDTSVALYPILRRRMSVACRDCHHPSCENNLHTCTQMCTVSLLYISLSVTVLLIWVVYVSFAAEEKCLMWAGAHPKFFLGVGETDPEAIHNLCLILKIMLQKSCCKYNITLSATAFIYIRI